MTPINIIKARSVLFPIDVILIRMRLIINRRIITITSGIGEDKSLKDK